jgi:quercetin dioxygenase-like cupin family protein
MNSTQSTGMLISIASIICLACSSSPVIADNQVFASNPKDTDLEWIPCTDVAHFFPQGCQATVLQGNPAERYADVLMRIPANAYIPNHYHTSAERMVLIAGEFHIHPDGQDTVVMTKGSYAYGPALAHHSAECKDAGDCYLFIAFEEPVDAIPVED